MFQGTMDPRVLRTEEVGRKKSHGRSFQRQMSELCLRIFALLWAECKALEESQEEESHGVTRVMGHDIEITLKELKRDVMSMFIILLK